MTPEKFIAMMVAPAQSINKMFRVPASVCIAQAALETGWGSSVVGNNYFGIKASTVGIPAVSSPTMEFIGGKWVVTVASFSRYASLNQSAFEYGAFLHQERYKPCFIAPTPQDFCTQLQACGYATDPNYADKLIAIIGQFNLTKYDIQP